MVMGKYFKEFSQQELDEAKALPTKEQRFNWVKANYQRILQTCGKNLSKKIIAIAGIGMNRKELRKNRIPGRPKEIRIRVA